MRVSRVRVYNYPTYGEDDCAICKKRLRSKGEERKRVLVGEDFPQALTTDQFTMCATHSRFEVRVFLATRGRSNVTH